MGINYAHLARKYIPDCSIIVEDRTFEGLVWLGPGEKPKLEVFESYQREEERIIRAAGLTVASQDSQMQEKQRQARAQADLDLIPFQKKLGEYFETERLKFLKLKQDTLELQARLALKEHALDCWREISEAQKALSDQAQAYLESTKHMLAWDDHKVPTDVMIKREEAHRLISEGQLVYPDWHRLREAEMPSQEDLAAALRAGGEHLERIRKACKAVALKYPKPRIQNF